MVTQRSRKEERAQYVRLGLPEALALIEMIEETRSLVAVSRGQSQDQVRLEHVPVDRTFVLAGERGPRTLLASSEMTTFGGVLEGWRCLIPNPSFGSRWGIRLPNSQFRLLRGSRLTPFERPTDDIRPVLPNEPAHILVLSEVR